MDLLDYEYIVWDWNGTLFDDVHLCAGIMNHLLEKRKLEKLSFEKYRKIFTFPVKDYYIKAGHDFSNESFETIGKEFMDEYEVRKYECSLFDSAERVLQFFSSFKIKHFLLSAYKQELLRDIINYIGISDYFVDVYGLDHIYADGKLELGRKLHNRISKNSKQTKTLMIGDTEHDYEVADQLGWDCLLIANGHQHKDVLDKTGISIMNNMDELYKTLLKQKGR